MYNSELTALLKEHYEREELSRAQWEEANRENLLALTEIKDFLVDMFSGSEDARMINLGGVYYHPDKELLVRAVAVPIVWKRKWQGRLSRFSQDRRTDHYSRYEPSEADVVTVDFVLLEDEKEPTVSSPIFAREYYGQHKDPMRSGHGDTEVEETVFDTSDEAVKIAKERREAVTSTVKMLREAAADPRLNPELASRLATA